MRRRSLLCHAQHRELFGFSSGKCHCHRPPPTPPPWGLHLILIDFNCRVFLFLSVFLGQSTPGGRCPRKGKSLDLSFHEIVVLLVIPLKHSFKKGIRNPSLHLWHKPCSSLSLIPSKLKTRWPRIETLVLVTCSQRIPKCNLVCICSLVVKGMDPNRFAAPTDHKLKSDCAIAGNLLQRKRIPPTRLQ